MWFKGHISEAIAKSKTDHKLFLVYIHGDDEASRKMDDIYKDIEREEVSMIEALIAIKLMAGSDNVKLFSQVYPVIVVPSTYLIGIDGVPLEIVGGPNPVKKDFMDRVMKAIKQNEDKIKGAMEKSLSPTSSHVKTEQKSSNESIPIEKKEEEEVKSQPTDEAIQESNIQSSTDDKVDKVERAQQLLEALRAKKEREEADREREQELERRKMGKEMHKAKKLKEELEMKEVLAEREKDKREEKLARERVLAQIAADKEERRKKFMNTGEANSTVSPVNAASTSGSTSHQSRTDIARIQFRLPNGNTHSQQFESSEKLENAKKFISTFVNFKDFNLCTVFPRQTFVDQDYMQSFLDLGLVPSTVLLVIPSNSNTGSSNPTSSLVSLQWLVQLFNLFLSPILYIWNIVKGTIGLDSNPNQSGPRKPTDRQTNRGPKKRGPDPNFYEKDGNIARIKTSKDDDEDNNTWNGNSTEQM